MNQWSLGSVLMCAFTSESISLSLQRSSTARTPVSGTPLASSSARISRDAGRLALPCTNTRKCASGTPTEVA